LRVKNYNKDLEKTIEQYQTEVDQCKNLFEQKNKDYGASWRILRPSSVTDQILIKALRIRSIEETGINKVGENIEDEFVGIYNYGIIALMQLKYWQSDETLSFEEIMQLYNDELESTKALMLKKNHDYGEAWREMRVSSLTDLILMKIQRTKQIEENSGKTVVSEGIDANYRDMMNYAIFALITLKNK